MGVDLICYDKDGKMNGHASDHGGTCPEVKKKGKKKGKMPRFKKGPRGDLNKLLGPGSIGEDVSNEMKARKTKKRK